MKEKDTIPAVKELKTDMPGTFKVVQQEEAGTDKSKQTSDQDNPEPDWTAEQEAKLDLKKFDVMASMYVDKVPYIKKALDTDLDYRNGHIHYIIREINPDVAAEYFNKKYVIEIYCNSDKNVQKRAKKFIRRYNASRSVEFLKIDI